MNNTPLTDMNSEITHHPMMIKALEDWHNRPLNSYLGEYIHYQAIHSTASGQITSNVPESVAERLSKTTSFGYHAHLFSKEYSQSLFEHMSNFWYQQIQSYFCTSVRPSVPNVWHIINRQRQQQNLPMFPYEAVWAICVYLQPKRNREDFTSRRFLPKWCLIKENLLFHEDVTQPPAECIVYIWDQIKSQVIAFVLGQDNDIELIPQALYRAFNSTRKIKPYVTNWHILHLPLVIQANMKPPSETTEFLQNLGITYQFTDLRPQVDFSWVKHLRRFYTSQAEILIYQIDAHFLHKYKHHVLKHEHVPEKQAKQTKVPQAELAQIYSELRKLLPKQHSIVTNGRINVNGRYYINNDILPLWEGESVDIRLSLDSYNQIWVYTKDGTLCDAQLRFPDGIKPKLRPWWENTNSFNLNHSTNPIRIFE